MAEEKKEDKKVKRPTALKRDMQNERRRLHNKSSRSSINTAINSLESALTKSDKADAKQKLSAVFSLMDKGVKTGLIKLNKASRVKANLTKRTQALK